MTWTVTQLPRESVGLSPFRGSYVREFELSHSNLVNRIIKITHTHILHVKMLDFAPFTLVYVKERILFTTLLYSNNFNKSPPFLTFVIKLCIVHYFTSNRIVKLPKY